MRDIAQREGLFDAEVEDADRVRPPGADGLDANRFASLRQTSDCCRPAPRQTGGVAIHAADTKAAEYGHAVGPLQLQRVGGIEPHVPIDIDRVIRVREGAGLAEPLRAATTGIG